MFQFPGFPPLELCIYSRVTSLQLAGFPHSDIKGSMPACGSPLLFAACHVLLRRLVPWHPPCALLRLITSILRLVTFTSGYFLTFLCNWSFKTFFLVFLPVQLSRCALSFLSFRILYRILKTIQMIERQLFLGHSILHRLPFLCLSFLSSASTVSFTVSPFRFTPAIDLGLKASLSVRLAP